MCSSLNPAGHSLDVFDESPMLYSAPYQRLRLLTFYFKQQPMCASFTLRSISFLNTSWSSTLLF
jgi:hypothetical protein